MDAAEFSNLEKNRLNLFPSLAERRTLCTHVGGTLVVSLPTYHQEFYLVPATFKLSMIKEHKGFKNTDNIGDRKTIFATGFAKWLLRMPFNSQLTFELRPYTLDMIRSNYPVLCHRRRCHMDTCKISNGGLYIGNSLYRIMSCEDVL